MNYKAHGKVPHFSDHVPEPQHKLQTPNEFKRCKNVIELWLFVSRPQVFWLKDGEMIDVKKEINFIISNEGNLIINQARLKDMGNYTCGAQNVASRRLSESATLTVYGK